MTYEDGDVEIGQEIVFIDTFGVEHIGRVMMVVREGNEYRVLYPQGLCTVYEEQIMGFVEDEQPDVEFPAIHKPFLTEELMNEATELAMEKIKQALDAPLLARQIGMMTSKTEWVFLNPKAATTMSVEEFLAEVSA